MKRRSSQMIINLISKTTGIGWVPFSRTLSTSVPTNRQSLFTCHGYKNRRQRIIQSCSNNTCLFGVTQKRHSHFAATLKELGKPLEVVEVENDAPKLSQTEVQLRVDSAGVNTADLSIIQGRHYLKPQLPFVPGFEVAGEVMRVGEKVTRFKAGDRVLGFKSLLRTGGFSQIAVLEENELYPIPYKLNYELAASLPIAYGRAFLAFEKVAKANVREGAHVLVLSSHGSTGIAAIDVAQNFYRCKVIASTESEEKCALVRPMGVLTTVEYTDENLPKIVRKNSRRGNGVDIVIDTVGGKWTYLALQSLRPGGHYCSLGFSSQEVPTLNLQDLIQHRVTISGISLGGYAQDRPEKFHQMLERIIENYDNGYISPQSGTTFPLEKINEALDSLTGKNSMGKVILTLR